MGVLWKYSGVKIRLKRLKTELTAIPPFSKITSHSRASRSESLHCSDVHRPVSNQYCLLYLSHRSGSFFVQPLLEVVTVVVFDFCFAINTLATLVMLGGHLSREERQAILEKRCVDRDTDFSIASQLVTLSLRIGCIPSFKAETSNK